MNSKTKLRFTAVLTCLLLVVLALLCIGNSDADAAVYNGSCGAEGENLVWSYDSDTRALEVTGKGAMADYASRSHVPWAAYRTTIKTVVIGDGVTYIGDKCFEGQWVLSSVTIPESVTEISGKAFFSSKAIASVVFGNTEFWYVDADYEDEEDILLSSSELSDASTAATCLKNYQGKKLCRIDHAHSYAGSVTAPDCENWGYTVHTCTVCGEWYKGEFVNVLGHVFDENKICTVCGEEYTLDKGVCGEGVTWRLYEDGRLVISGEGAIQDAPYLGYKASTYAKKIIISDGITSIGESAFDMLRNVTEAVIPSSVRYIGDNSFYGTALSSIDIPDGVTWIGEMAFYGTPLVSVKIPDSVKVIGSCAFFECASLTSINMGKGVESIGSSAFTDTGYYKDEGHWKEDMLYLGDILLSARENESGEYVIENGTRIIASHAFGWLENAVKITVPETVKIINFGAFECCYKLTEVNIPTGVTVIEDAVFSGCESLESITIPDGVVSIGNHAFGSMRRLVKVVIPDSVKTISEGAFSDCSSLMSITLGKGVSEIQGDAFAVCGKLAEVINRSELQLTLG
ncbi:MAG: leucine-rich repeat protein, partial [Clostridia bacterium]|nr:leucine-rich repeat protein [Clostridia bacterium]